MKYIKRFIHEHKEAILALFTSAIFIFTMCVLAVACGAVKKNEVEAAAIDDFGTSAVEIVLETKPVETVETVETEVDEPHKYFDVPLSKELQNHIFAECEKHGVDPAVVIAMCFRESTYRADAIGDNGRSFGLMQIQERYHKERMVRLGVTDLLDPVQNVTVGIDFLAELLEKYGDVEKALTAYNRGHYAGAVTQYAVKVLEVAGELKG